MLLSEADEYTEHQTDERAEGGDEPTLQQEDTTDHPFVCTEVGQDTDIFAFIDDEHRERTDAVKTGDKKDEDQQKDGQQFLNPQDTEEIGLLLISIQHPKSLTEVFLN